MYGLAVNAFLIFIFLYLIGFSRQLFAENKLANTDKTSVQRQRMVEEQIEGRDTKDSRILDAMRKIPRHLFIDSSLIDAIIITASANRIPPLQLKQLKEGGAINNFAWKHTTLSNIALCYK